MWAAAYQRSEPASCCICGPGTSSITSDGWACASVAKKKSEPRPAHAVPSLRSLASKLSAIALRRPALPDFARSINCGADIFSAAVARAVTQNNTRAYFHIAQILYRVRWFTGLSSRKGLRGTACSLSGRREPDCASTSTAIVAKLGNRRSHPCLDFDEKP